MNGFDRVVDGEDNWFHGPRSLPPTPEEFAASLWSEVKTLKDAISMPTRGRFSSRAKSFIKEIGQGTVNSTDTTGQFTANMTDEEFVIFKRLVETRCREAVKVTVTPVSTVRHSIPRSLNPEMPPDVCVSLKSNEGKEDPEREELELPSAGTGFETPGQQYHPTRETGRTTTGGFLTAGVGSNLGKHNSSTTERAGARASTKITTTSADISSPTEHVGMQAGTASTPAKPWHKTTSKENKQFDPGRKGEKAPLWNAAVILSFFFLGGDLGHGRLVVFASCSYVFMCLSACSVFYLLFLSDNHFSAS